MDAFELLKKDHKKVSQLFKEIEAASDTAKKQIFARLKSELDLHAKVEEDIFYPALENKEEARDITLEAYEEHKVVKDLLAELDSGRAQQDEWDAKLTVLKENVEHHVEEEEGELFSKARKALSADQIDELGARMEAEKNAQQGGGAASTKTEARSNSNNRARTGAKKSGTAKSSDSPGVLKRLANLVGLGGDEPAKRSGKRGGASKSTKTSGSKKAAKKTAAKGAGKSAAAKSSKAGKKATKKSTRKSAASSRAKGARKSPARGAKKAQKRTTRKRGR